MIDEKCWADAHLMSVLTRRPQVECYEKLIQERKTADLESQLHQWQEREAAVCPEDVGFEEYIKALQSQLQQEREKRKEAESENTKLRATIAAMQDALEEVKARCELRRQDDDAHYENYYEAKQALAIVGYGGEE